MKLDRLVGWGEQTGQLEEHDQVSSLREEKLEMAICRESDSLKVTYDKDDKDKVKFNIHDSELFIPYNKNNTTD